MAARRSRPHLVAVLEALAEAGSQLAREIARAALTGRLGETGDVNAHGDRVRRLDVRTNDLLLAALEATRRRVGRRLGGTGGAGRVATAAADAEPLAVCLDPLDGSLNTDVAGVLGTIFGDPRRTRRRASPIRPGRCWARARGRSRPATSSTAPPPSSSTRRGPASHAFVLDPADGRFRLTRADVRMPPAGRTYAVNDANWPRWSPAARALVERLRGARPGGLPTPSGTPAPWSRTSTGRSSRAASTSIRRTRGRPEGRIRLLYEAAPLALVAEAAGGRASTGRARILDVVATDYHQRTPIYIGSAEEVDLGRARPTGTARGMTEEPGAPALVRVARTAGGLAGRPEPLLPHR